MKILFKWLANALVVLVVAYLVPGFTISSFVTALVVVVVIALLNTFIKPLVKLLTLPINILTLGLFSFVINAGILWLTAYFIGVFYFFPFRTAILAAVAMSVVGMVVNKLIK